MSCQSIEDLIAAVKDRWYAQRLKQDFAPIQLISLEMDQEPAWMQWLDTPVNEKVYWQSRDGRTEAVGLGVASQIICTHQQQLPDAWQQLQTVMDQCDPRIRWYGGQCFNPCVELDQAWQPFGLFRFWVPRVVIRREDQICCLEVADVSLDDNGLEEAVALIRACSDQAPCDRKVPVSKNYVDLPEKAEWIDQVTRVCHDLEQHDAKVVLSVKRIYDVTGPVDTVSLFDQARIQAKGGFQYYYQVDGCVLMGISPECLYQRQGEYLVTEALAGTGEKSDDLLSQYKDNTEHDFVIRDVTEAMHAICDQVECQPDKELHAWKDLVHLKTALSGVVKPNVTDRDLIQTLHPSAAVLGYPRDKAWQWLSQYEAHVRGWYAGPIGWLCQRQAQFAVAIRCALVSHYNIHLFAGAGLVTGSRPDQEWQEIHNKMRLFVDLLCK